MNQVQPPHKRLKTSRFINAAKIAPMVSLLVLAACASAPKPAVPDGSTRVQINDPSRLSQLHQQNITETTANNDRAYFKAEIAALKGQVEALNRVVRSTLILPAGILTPPPEKNVSQVAPAAATPVEPVKVAPVATPVVTPVAAVTGIPVTEATKGTIEKTADGVIVRQFHQFGKFEFTPSTELASALRAAGKTAQVINVSGYTDSQKADSANNYVAAARALSARRWLIENGVASDRIHSRFEGSGHFLVDNTTKSGRALNRRVELDIKGSDNSSLVSIQEKADKS